MYVEPWSPGLRQGDILGPIFLPLLGTTFAVGFQSRTLVGPAPGDEQHVTVTLPAANEVVTVISHCCEFNEGKRNKLLVARLQNVPGNLNEEERQTLRESNDVKARSDAELTVAAIDSFLFSPVPGFLDAERVANFATIAPLPMKMVDELAGQKRAELDQDTRQLFRYKLAWFVGRPTDPGPENIVAPDEDPVAD